MFEKLKGGLKAAGVALQSAGIVIADTTAATLGTVSAVAGVAKDVAINKMVTSKALGGFTSTVVVANTIVGDQLSQKWTAGRLGECGLGREALRMNTRDKAWATYEVKHAVITESPAETAEPKPVIIGNLPEVATP